MRKVFKLDFLPVALAGLHFLRGECYNKKLED